MHSKVLDEITYPSPNSNGVTVGVWEWISNFIPHLKMEVIIYAGIKVKPFKKAPAIPPTNSTPCSCFVVVMIPVDVAHINQRSFIGTGHNRQ